MPRQPVIALDPSGPEKIMDLEIKGFDQWWANASNSHRQEHDNMQQVTTWSEWKWVVLNSPFHGEKGARTFYHGPHNPPM
ncbi:hypothetical protein BPOR_0357g00100 [Botrytis porri]|uniref:Uncharacterized protein n=1 Tax=Botrytis porri TaxID=87229 RepID=A0A4Z1KQ08_9HELO|nr:hypothetical protein BPOR_0357g00100 [Botrytis porri]